MAEQNAAAEPTASKPVEAKGQKPVLFIILAVVNMLIVAGVGTMLYLGKKKKPPNQPSTMLFRVNKKHKKMTIKKKKSSLERLFQWKLFWST